jgi:hypothetical protein
MPRKRRPQRDLNREKEILSAPINPDGSGEQPVVRALLSPEFATMSDSKALDIGLALQQLIQGQSALLSQQDFFAKELADLRAKFAAYDESVARFEADEKGFLEQTLRVGEKNRPTGDKLAVAQNRGMAMYQAAVTTERLKAQKKFEAELASMPTETITVGGIPRMVRSGDTVALRMEPLMVTIKHRRWILPPNIPTVVPKVVADQVRAWLRAQAETSERAQALTENLPSDDLARRYRDIDQKYGTPSGALPAGE